jgi:hypothetical protein
MRVELTEQQQQALDSEPEHPPRLVDPRTNTTYLLVRAEEYERIREALEDQWRRGVHAVAMRNAMGRMDDEP